MGAQARPRPALADMGELVGGYWPAEFEDVWQPEEYREAAAGRVNGEGVVVVWTPNPGPQTALIECPVQDIFFGGARFGGKTDGALGHFAVHAQRWGQHAHGVLFRRTFAELEEVIKRSKQIYSLLGWTYNITTKTWATPNGGTLKLRYLYRPGDESHYQGHSYTWLCFDELGNWPDPEPIDILWATLRSTHVPARYLQRLCTGNPGGPGHAWVKHRYITPEGGFQAPFTPFRYTPLPDLRPDLTIEAVFIPSRLEDNPQADTAGYEAQLAATSRGSAARFKAWRYGDWDAFAGQAFEEWRPDVHVVPNRTLPDDWPRLGVLDWGIKQGYFATGKVDPEGNLEADFEIAFSKMDAESAAEACMKLAHGADRMPELLIYDEAMQQDLSRLVKGGETTLAQWRRGMARWAGGDRERLPVLTPGAHAPGSRRAKFSAFKGALKVDTDAAGNIPSWFTPGLRFQRRCAYAIRTIPALPEDPLHPGEDVDTEAEDHAYDAWCFALQRAQAKRPVERDRDRHPGLSKQGRAKRPGGTSAEIRRDVGDPTLEVGRRYILPRPVGIGGDSIHDYEEIK